MAQRPGNVRANVLDCPPQHCSRHSTIQPDDLQPNRIRRQHEPKRDRPNSDKPSKTHLDLHPKRSEQPKTIHNRRHSLETQHKRI